MLLILYTTLSLRDLVVTVSLAFNLRLDLVCIRFCNLFLVIFLSLIFCSGCCGGCLVVVVAPPPRNFLLPFGGAMSSC